jgi:hypothetical protein
MSWATSTNRRVRYPASAVFKRGVGQPFSSAVRGDKVFQDRQTFAEVGNDGRLDDFAHSARDFFLRFLHQTAHAGQLTNLLAAARAPESAIM